jgi:murein L,D-transpeptidase YcbB/YkuD
MRRGYLAAVLLCTFQALALPVMPAGCANTTSAAPVATLADQQPPAAETTPLVSPADPVITVIRSRLTDPGLREGANADDLAALEAFYRAKTGGPLWMTEMGFSAKAQQALFEIEKADDWGLEAATFELPAAGDLPAGPDAEAIAEIKLDLAILKYARFARGGRVNPPELSGLFDQAPPLRDPKKIMIEIAAAETPDAYLHALHPKHEQFVRLRQALLKARDRDADGVKPAGNATDIRRLIINMERWRWMPEQLGGLYVWSNTPEFMLYVVKDRETIYADKTQVGTIGDPTPVFSAAMTTIVFNPEWIAPGSVLVKDLLPRLRKKNYAILDKHRLSVSYQGDPVNPTKIDWERVNIRDYTFTQKPGPESNLGKVKFLLPNKHDVLLHDTFPSRRNVFQKAMRAIGYGCVRMEKPDRLAELVLGESNGLSSREVKDLWDNSVNSPVTLDHKIPVHLTYFTAVVDEAGKVATFADLYGLDRKLATKLFGDATGFPLPIQGTKRPQVEEADESAPVKRTSTSIDVNPAYAGEIVGATWYGNEFRGSHTASGETFNPDGLTVAHRSLPFGTCLVVGNPKTGRTVVVRVNDRGPFTEGMTLDLSAGAARAIGMRSTQDVTIKRC